MIPTPEQLIHPRSVWYMGQHGHIVIAFTTMLASNPRVERVRAETPLFVQCASEFNEAVSLKRLTERVFGGAR